MSGIFHFIFGVMFGVFAWKLTNKRWSFGLLIVFIVNAYLGPDQRRLWKMAGFSMNSRELVLFGTALHTYLGWALFAVIWSPLWMAVINFIDKYRNKNGPILKHSYPDFFLAVFSGGLLHLWVDTFGNINTVEGINFTKGAVDLIVWDAGIIPAYLGVGLFILILIIVHILFFKKIPEVNDGVSKSAKLKQSFTNFLSDKKNLYVVLFIGITILNTLLMIYILVYGGFNPYYEVTEKGYIEPFYRYRQGDALFASTFNGEGLWFSVIMIALLIIGLIYTYIKQIRVTLRKVQIRGEIIVILVFLLVMVIGYALQPYIGSLSEKEADAASWLFVWSLVIFPMLPFLIMEGKAIEKNNLKHLYK